MKLVDTADTVRMLLLGALIAEIALSLWVVGCADCQTQAAVAARFADTQARVCLQTVRENTRQGAVLNLHEKPRP